MICYNWYIRKETGFLPLTNKVKNMKVKSTQQLSTIKSVRDLSYQLRNNLNGQILGYFVRGPVRNSETQEKFEISGWAEVHDLKYKFFSVSVLEKDDEGNEVEKLVKCTPCDDSEFQIHCDIPFSRLG